MRIVGYVPDLMDRSRLGGAVELVDDPAELVGAEAELVLLDVGRPGVLDVVGRITAPTLGFCAHVDDALMSEASAAGCDEVLPRSRVFRRLAALLADEPGTSSR
ncbi:MAG: hypothetical protein AAFZ07_06275 [Actinomycetota bacterium]